MFTRSSSFPINALAGIFPQNNSLLMLVDKLNFNSAVLMNLADGKASNIELLKHMKKMLSVINHQAFIRTTQFNVQCDNSNSFVQHAGGNACSPDSRPLELIGNSGTFSSPNYPYDYYDNSVCDWRIMSTVSNGVSIPFTFINVVISLQTLTSFHDCIH